MTHAAVGEGNRLYCRVCGGNAVVFLCDLDKLHTYRCHSHRRSNPCAIEGCSRSKAAKGQLHDGTYWVCSDHWRVVCPPRSPQRRAYLRFFRTAKKLGLGMNDRWPADLEMRFWRYFRGLVRRGRRRCAGDMDMTAINKLFGWDGC